MLMDVQATEVFIGDLLVSPAEDYKPAAAQLSNHTAQIHMEHINVYILEVFISDTA